MFLSNVVRWAAAKSSLGNPDMLAQVASGLVWAFAIVVAVNYQSQATCCGQSVHGDIGAKPGAGNWLT